jgi:CheY-like chemotaxis protein
VRFAARSDRLMSRQDRREQQKTRYVFCRMTADRYNPLSAARLVLVVEPDVLVRVVVAEYLRESGLMVIEAIDAVEAMAVHRSDLKVEVTLVNVASIGETPSFELARRIRAETPQAHVVLVSTVASMAREIRQLCSGGRAGSHKAAMLEQRLRRLLRQ